MALDQSIWPPMLFSSWPIKYKDQSILAPPLFFHIFLDLCKAFDTVDHRIILNKLEYNGIRGVANDWFASYLSNRRQFVSLFGTNSDYQTVTCGVPQGSVLGSLLFLLYINDTVDHRIILNKLEYNGIRGVANDWFASYLSNRRQFVSLFGTNSDYQTVTCGVPQGSVLGSLLFLLYINDMPKCSNILEFNLFADGTNLFLNSPNILNLETNLNVELGKGSQWLYANKLSLNI